MNQIFRTGELMISPEVSKIFGDDKKIHLNLMASTPFHQNTYKRKFVFFLQRRTRILMKRPPLGGSKCGSFQSSRSSLSK